MSTKKASHICFMRLVKTTNLYAKELFFVKALRIHGMEADYIDLISLRSKVNIGFTIVHTKKNHLETAMLAS